MRKIGFALAAMLALAGCSARATNQPTQHGGTQAPSQAAASANMSTPARTPTLTLLTTAPSPAAAASVCIIQIPAQMGTDYTPMTFVYYGTDAATCAQYLAKQNANATGWEAQHPATIVYAVPAGNPVCSGTVGGLSIAIYGTAAAEYACSAMGLK